MNPEIIAQLIARAQEAGVDFDPNDPRFTKLVANNNALVGDKLSRWEQEDGAAGREFREEDARAAANDQALEESFQQFITETGQTGALEGRRFSDIAQRPDITPVQQKRLARLSAGESERTGEQVRPDNRVERLLSGLERIPVANMLPMAAGAISHPIETMQSASQAAVDIGTSPVRYLAGKMGGEDFRARLESMIADMGPEGVGSGSARFTGSVLGTGAGFGLGAKALGATPGVGRAIGALGGAGRAAGRLALGGPKAGGGAMREGMRAAAADLPGAALQTGAEFSLIDPAAMLEGGITPEKLAVVLGFGGARAAGAGARGARIGRGQPPPRPDATDPVSMQASEMYQAGREAGPAEMLNVPRASVGEFGTPGGAPRGARAPRDAGDLQRLRDEVTTAQREVDLLEGEANVERLPNSGFGIQEKTNRLLKDVGEFEGELNVRKLKLEVEDAQNALNRLRERELSTSKPEVQQEEIGEILSAMKTLRTQLTAAKDAAGGAPTKGAGFRAAREAKSRKPRRRGRRR